MPSAILTRQSFYSMLSANQTRQYSTVTLPSTIQTRQYCYSAFSHSDSTLHCSYAAFGIEAVGTVGFRAPAHFSGAGHVAGSASCRHLLHHYGEPGQLSPMLTNCSSTRGPMGSSLEEGKAADCAGIRAGGTEPVTENERTHWGWPWC